jgi:Cu+-exporting ATPase
MEVDPKSAAGTTEYEGQSFYFCSAECKREFEEDPESYLEQEERLSE